MSPATADKIVSEDDVVGELRSGMTIGIGGWGSRRKPMSLVQAILRSDLTDLTVVYLRRPRPRPAVRRREGEAGALRLRVPRLDPARPHFRAARRGRTIETSPTTRVSSCSGCRPPRGGCRSCPRVGLGSDLFRDNPRLRTIVSPYDDGETLVAAPALHLDAALVHLSRADPEATPATSVPTRTSTTCSWPRPTGRSCRRSTSCPPTTSNRPSASPGS